MENHIICDATSHTVIASCQHLTHAELIARLLNEEGHDCYIEDLRRIDHDLSGHETNEHLEQS